MPFYVYLWTFVSTGIIIVPNVLFTVICVVLLKWLRK